MGADCYPRRNDQWWGMESCLSSDMVTNTDLMVIAFADDDAEKESKYSERQKQEKTKSQKARTLDGTKDEMPPNQKPKSKGTRQGDSDIAQPFVEKA